MLLLFCQANAAAPVAAPLRKRTEKTNDGNEKMGKSKDLDQGHSSVLNRSCNTLGLFPIAALGCPHVVLVLPGHD